MKISVIIPVYNTREYLYPCIDSVLQQSIGDVEILIVDDGSTDGSWELLEKYRNKYNNIRLFRQNRQRQGAARNLALHHATGDFIAFLDSDDFVPSEAYKRMYEVAQKNGTDLVIGVQQSFSKMWRKIGVPVHRYHFRHEVASTNILSFPELLSDISACNKLFRASKLKETGIVFPEQTSGEDLDFTARVYLNFDKISVIPLIVYNYRSRDNASTGRIMPSFFHDRVNTTQRLATAYAAEGKKEVFQFLLRSELRKLVGKRLTRVMQNSPEDEREAIINHIQSLSSLAEYHALMRCNDLGSFDKLRIMLIREKEGAALNLFVANERDAGFLQAVRNADCKNNLVPIWREFRSEWSNPFSRAGVRKRKYQIQQKLSGLKRFVRRQYYRYRRDSLYLILRKIWRLVLVLKYLLLFLYTLDNRRFQGAWIMDERWGSSAEDNGLHLFLYLRSRYPELPLYYIIKKDSQHREKIDSRGNVVALYSSRHFKLLQNAAVLISTDSFKALAVPFEEISGLRRETVNVFLQHGVSGNKTMSYYKERHPYFNMVVTSNEREKQSFVEVYGFNDNEVVVTGLARFDSLPLHRTSPQIKKILVAPTWRKWLADQDDIQDSLYFKEWSGFLTSVRLAEILQRHDIELIFQPHFNMLKFMHAFKGKSERISIIMNTDEPLQQYIIDSDLLITDYSSVMYDFFFQLKPVFSIMFDRVDWECPPCGPPLIDFEKDLPLRIFLDKDRLLDFMENSITSDFRFDEPQLQQIDSLFAARDHNNCRRIYESIAARLHGW